MHVRLVLALLIALSSLAPGAARASFDDEAIAAGRLRARVLLVFRSPRICATVVMVRRCLDDVARFVGPAGNSYFKDIPKIGPAPYDRLVQYIVSGDPAGLDPQLSYINSSTLPPGNDPRNAALQDAAIGTTLYDAAFGNVVLQLLTLGDVIAIAKLPSDPDLPLLTADERTTLQNLQATRRSDEMQATRVDSHMSEIVTITRDFAARFDERHPAAPYPQFRLDGSPYGLVRLGVASTFLSNLIEQPFLSAQPETKATVAEIESAIELIAPATAADVATYNEAIAQLDRPKRLFSFRALESVTRQILAVTGKIDTPGGKAFVTGALSAALGYNAAVLRSTDFATSSLVVLGRIPSPPGLSPGDEAALTTLRSCPGADLACQRTASTAFVQNIMTH